MRSSALTRAILAPALPESHLPPGLTPRPTATDCRSRAHGRRLRDSANAIRALLQRLAPLGWHGVEHLLHVFDTVAADLQCERRRLPHEAPVAAADRPGRDEAVAVEAAVTLGERPPDGIAPI